MGVGFTVQGTSMSYLNKEKESDLTTHLHGLNFFFNVHEAD